MIPSVIALITCPQLCRLSWAFLPVVDFLAWPRLWCPLLTFTSVLNFAACSGLWNLSSTFLPVLNFAACSRLYACLRLWQFSLCPALRPGRVMVLMCLSVCLSVCLSAPPPKAWTFRSKTDSKADNRRQSPGQATKLWTCQGQSMKAENRWQQLKQAKKINESDKTKNRQQSQRHVTKLALS